MQRDPGHDDGTGTDQGMFLQMDGCGSDLAVFVRHGGIRQMSPGIIIRGGKDRHPRGKTDIILQSDPRCAHDKNADTEMNMVSYDNGITGRDDTVAVDPHIRSYVDITTKKMYTAVDHDVLSTHNTHFRKFFRKVI